MGRIDRPLHGPPGADAPATRGGIGLAPWLVAAGTYVFAATATVSIAACEAGVVLAFVGVVVSLLLGRKRYRRTPLDLPLLLFAAAEVASLLVARDRAHAVRSLRGEWVLLFYPLFVQALDRGRVRRACNLLVAVAGLVAIYAVWQTIFGVDLVRHRPLERIGGLHIAIGFFDHHLTYGGSVLITTLSSLGLSRLPASPAATGLRLASAAAQWLGLVVSFARTAWAGFLAATLGGSLVARGRARRVAVAALALGVLVAAVVPAIRERIGSPAALLDDPRVRLWHTALRIWVDHPILGAGMGAFKVLFPAYRVPGTYDATGNPHNEVLNILVNCGVVGLAAFGFLWVRFYRHAARAYRSLPAGDAARPILLAGMLVATGILVGGFGQCYLLDEEVAGLFWFVIAATMVTAETASAGAQDLEGS